jgi:uncharacterized protein (DUF488 family)
MKLTVYTIGHSTQSAEELVAALKQAGITAVGDVRSRPYSRFNPQYNRETLKATLKSADIAYVFLGDQLGARTEDTSCYRDGKVQYDLLAQTDSFREGLERVEKGAGRWRIALMCAEKDPVQCHRTILVARHLSERGIDVQHILPGGELESHAEALKRLKRQLHLPEQDLFLSADELDAQAYRVQGERIAYRDDNDDEAAA